MTIVNEAAPWEALEVLIDRGDAQALRAEVDGLGMRESARALSRLTEEQRSKVFNLLGPEVSADLMEEMADDHAAELINQLSPEEAAPILSEMESADSADVLSRLHAEKVEALLGAMKPEAAQDARLLSKYEANVAGGLMITEYLAFPETYTVREVIDDMRTNNDKYREYSVQYTYVVAPEGGLVGVLPLRDLLLTPGKTPIESIMIKNPLCVEDHNSLDDLVELFEDYNFLGVPVVDSGAHLVGIVRRTDVMEAIGERAQSDFLKAQGIVSGEELRSMPVLTRARRRLSWLSINIVLNIIAASIIAVYQDTLASVIALAVFLPIISDMSGCSGNQAVAVSMRELTLGLIKPFEVVRVWLKEASVGIINGLVLGSMLAAVAIVWKGNPYLGLVVGTAMAGNTLIAVLLGGAVPLILKRFKADPALASGPILTTVTDMCGFFIVLSLASAMLPLLT